MITMNYSKENKIKLHKIFNNNRNIKNLKTIIRNLVMFKVNKYKLIL